MHNLTNLESANQTTEVTLELNAEDTQRLQYAKQILENPGLVIKISNKFGTGIEKVLGALPEDTLISLNTVVEASLKHVAQFTLFTMKDSPGEPSSNNLHKIGTAITGGLGGVFGLASATIEIPITTALIIRSIMDIARSEGESIEDPDTQLACLEVLALGGTSKADDGAETGYYSVRIALGQTVSQSAAFLAKGGQVENAITPGLISLLKKVAEAFSKTLTQKVAAIAVPAIGAAGGVIINTIFMDHFQDMARGHFIIRNLEKKYGKERIQAMYAELPLIHTPTQESKE